MSRDDADRLPPQDLDMERGVIGSALLDERLLDELASTLRPEDFYRDTHQILWRELQAMRSEGTPVDGLTVAERLRRLGLYERVGPESFDEICGFVPHGANGRTYGAVVSGLAVLRRLIWALGDGIERCYAGRGQKRVEEIVAEVEQAVLAASRVAGTGDLHDAGVATTEALDAISTREHGVPSGLRTGFESFDVLLDGLKPAQLVILAGRPGNGKTSLALDIASHAALVESRSVLFCSLEMGRLDLADRLLSSRGRVAGVSIRSGRGLTAEDWVSMARVHQALGRSRFVIDDASSRSVSELAALCRRRMATHGLDLIVVDYLQLLRPAATKNASRQEQVAQISRDLKCLAKDCGVPVLVLSQLNRQVEQRDDRRPRLSDLRESGAIEQDADVVLLLHHSTDQRGPSELIVAKNRSGPTGTIHLNYAKAFTTFESWNEVPAGAF